MKAKFHIRVHKLWATIYQKREKENIVSPYSNHFKFMRIPEKDSSGLGHRGRKRNQNMPKEKPNKENQKVNGNGLKNDIQSIRKIKRRSTFSFLLPPTNTSSAWEQSGRNTQLRHEWYTSTWVHLLLWVTTWGMDGSVSGRRREYGEGEGRWVKKELPLQVSWQSK